MMSSSEGEEYVKVITQAVILLHVVEIELEKFEGIQVLYAKRGTSLAWTISTGLTGSYGALSQGRQQCTHPEKTGERVYLSELLSDNIFMFL